MEAIPSTIGKYQVEAELGRGGFAVVYRAFDPILRRRVALKTPHVSLVDQETTDRFLREAQLAAGLSHPHIMTVYEVGDVKGVPYIAMELLEGVTLHEWMRGDTQTPEKTLKTLTGIGAALDYAHRKGVIHRDVKPANILVIPGRGAVLTDFGIARALEQTGHSLSSFIGTPAYMAPEQVNGQPITAAADIYALGILLYQVVVGRLPFTASTPIALAAQHGSTPPPNPRQIKPSVPQAAADLLLKTLSKDPQQRPVSAEKLIRDLIAALGGQKISIGKEQTLPIALAGIGIVVVLLLTWAMIELRSPATPTPGPSAASPQPPGVDATLPPLSPQPPAFTGGANLFVEYILDGSGSMQEPLGDKTKLEVAKEALAEHMRQLPIDSNLGLRVYGHRVPFSKTKESCQDVELIAPVVRGQGERIADWLGSMQAQGMSPIGLALRQAASDFVFASGRDNRIVLVSDGKETCGIDPCQEMDALRAQGFQFTVNVIGLNLSEEARTQLSCVAKKSGGSYKDAKTPQDLTDGLIEGTQPTAPIETVSPTAPADGTTSVSPEVTPTSPDTVIMTAEITNTPSISATPTPTKRPVEPIVFVTPALLNLRAGPGLNFPIVGQAVGGSSLRIISSARERTATGERIWYEVCCATNGAQGWVFAGGVSTPSTPIPTTTRYPLTPTPTRTRAVTATPTNTPTPEFTNTPVPEPTHDPGKPTPPPPPT